MHTSVQGSARDLGRVYTQNLELFLCSSPFWDFLLHFLTVLSSALCLLILQPISLLVSIWVLAAQWHWQGSASGKKLSKRRKKSTQKLTQCHHLLPRVQISPGSACFWSLVSSDLKKLFGGLVQFNLLPNFWKWNSLCSKILTDSDFTRCSKHLKISLKEKDQ